MANGGYDKFTAKAASSVKNMKDAFKALDSGDPKAVEALASAWGLQRDEVDADKLIADFQAAQHKPVLDDTNKLC